MKMKKSNIINFVVSSVIGYSMFYILFKMFVRIPEVAKSLNMYAWIPFVILTAYLIGSSFSNKKVEIKNEAA